MTIYAMSIWTNLEPHAHFNVVPTAPIQNGPCATIVWKALEQEGRPIWRNTLKRLEMAVHRLHEFVHEIGIDRKVGQTNDIKDKKNIWRDGIYWESKTSIVKMQLRNKLMKKMEE